MDSSHRPPDGHPVDSDVSAHVLVCVGPSCSSRGSGELYAQVAGGLEAERLAYYCAGGSIRLNRTDCLGACDHGPTIALYATEPADAGLVRRSCLVRMSPASTLALAADVHARWTNEHRP